MSLFSLNENKFAITALNTGVGGTTANVAKATTNNAANATQNAVNKVKAAASNATANKTTTPAPKPVDTKPKATEAPKATTTPAPKPADTTTPKATEAPKATTTPAPKPADTTTPKATTATNTGGTTPPPKPQPPNEGGKLTGKPSNTPGAIAEKKAKAASTVPNIPNSTGSIVGNNPFMPQKSNVVNTEKEKPTPPPKPSSQFSFDTSKMTTPSAIMKAPSSTPPAAKTWTKNAPGTASYNMIDEKNDSIDVIEAKKKAQMKQQGITSESYRFNRHLFSINENNQQSYNENYTRKGINNMGLFRLSEDATTPGISMSPIARRKLRNAGHNNSNDFNFGEPNSYYDNDYDKHFLGDGDDPKTSQLNIPAILAAKTAGGTAWPHTVHNCFSNKLGSDVFKLKKLRDDEYTPW